MTKLNKKAMPKHLIDLGAATVQTKGSEDINQDGNLNQRKEPFPGQVLAD